jgi:hypothetical protein
MRKLDGRAGLVLLIPALLLAACAPTPAPPATQLPTAQVATEPVATAQIAATSPTEPLPATAAPPTAEPLTLAPTAGPTATVFRLPAAGFALKFSGTGRGDVDRVKIKLEPQVAANVDADFTLEFWMRAAPGDNTSPGANCNSNDGWITGNIMFDRDVFNEGDHGDYGLSLSAGRIAFGTNVRGQGNTLCGVTEVADDEWHHIAVTRSGASGQLRIFVDGKLDGEGDGPTGDLSYRVGRATQFPNDPYLVIGAEKHDYDNTAFPSYRGWIDEVRLSRIIRYTGDFPRPTAPFTSDADTAALYHFDEGVGATIGDSSPGGGSPGELRVGGEAPTPQWLPSDAPLTAAP